jgi:hypothetical protein
MNRHGRFSLVSFAVIVFAPATLLAGETKQIQERELDEHSVCAVPVSAARVTTVSFPGPISAIDAALVTTDGKTAARSVSGTTLPSDAIESVRYAENIKTYPLGRYVDPNNSRIMHET